MRKVHPGMRARNGMRFPFGAISGSYVPESTLKLGCGFRTTGQNEVAVE